MIYRNIIDSGKEFLANTGRAFTIAAAVACASLAGACQSPRYTVGGDGIRVPADAEKRAEYINALEDLNSRQFNMRPSEFVDSFRRLQNQYIEGQHLVVPPKREPLPTPSMDSYFPKVEPQEEPKSDDVNGWNWADPTFTATRLVVDCVLGAPINWVRGKGFTRAHNSDAYAGQDWKYRLPEAIAGGYGLAHYAVKNNHMGENTPLAEILKILNIRDGIKHPKPAPVPPTGLNGGSTSTGFGGGQVSGDDDDEKKK